MRGGADPASATNDTGWNMKASAIWVGAALLAVAVSASNSTLAAEGGASSKSGSILGVLAGTAVPLAELGKEQARGIVISTGAGAAANAGTSANNAVIGNNPITGTVNLDHSIDNNAGITSVLQNFGNNSVMQVSTTINISVTK
jgi:hypothetical protein